jgi:hypothetical protein
MQEHTTIMDLTTAIPARFELFDGQPGEIALLFGKDPFNLATGKFVSVLLDEEVMKPPAFVLNDVVLPYDWHERYKTLSVPAPEGGFVRDLAERIEELVHKAAATHAMQWFGKDATVVAAALSVKSGLRDAPCGIVLTVKAPTPDAVPDFYTTAGVLAAGPEPLRGSTCDLLVSVNGLFVRGFDVFVQWKLQAVAKRVEGNPARARAGNYTRIA